MNKNLILLIILLPLILMLSLFSISNSVTLSFSIPVSKIEILGDRIVYLDLDKDEKYSVDYVVYPTNAKNKQVYLLTEPVGSEPLAEVEYVDGKIVGKSCGKAKAYLVTVDGGFRDSFIIQVDSKMLMGIDSQIDNSSIYVGETAKINTTFIPEDAETVLEYYVADQFKNIVSVSAGGVVTGLAKGVAEIEVMARSNNQIKDIVTVQVKNKDIMDLEKPQLDTWYKQGSINISVDTEEQCDYIVKVYDKNRTELTPEQINIDLNRDNESDGRVSINYELVDKQYLGDLMVEITIQTAGGLTVTKNCNISFINQITAEFTNKQVSKVSYDSLILEEFSVLPSDLEVEVECLVSNDNIETTIDANNVIFIEGKKLGVSEIILKIYNKQNKDEFVEIKKEIVVTKSNTKNIIINESAKTYGIENVFTFAKKGVNGDDSSTKLTLGGLTAGEGFSENITWISTSSNATIDKDGNITLIGTSGSEMVGFTAKFSYKGIEYLSNRFEINCIYDGLNIYNYIDLWTATNASNPKPIVLHNDIKDDFAMGVASYYKEITTTYDKTYYQNIGKLDKAKIKVLIEFKNNVYGNGYCINAHNVAWLKNIQNATTNAVFSGPLNFVAMSETGGMVSVKAQDNVCFAVYENVTISNIVLKGCDLQADNNGEYDLTDLTYTGTTVEVFGDNVNIQYSRISNGRTVLRAFGDIDDSTKEINLTIKNSVLSGAREFILRLGSNCFVDGSKQNPSPTLPGDSTGIFPAQKYYETMTDEQRSEYDEKFIKTFVTIKNSVFKDAGIFAIGIDTHFAGEALADGTSYLGGLVKDWYNLAKTSYGVKLTFDGDVRMYNWKKLSDVDSSSLIEVLGSTSFADISFNVAELVEAISNNEKFKDIVYTEHETSIQYVHAGIAMFGGGKNYSVFYGKRDDNSNNTTYDFNTYEVKLSDVGKEMLQVASGNESFYFLLDQTFLPENQEEILKSNDAYACIYKK